MAKTLNENIKQLRIRSGLNQVELGKRLNVSKQCVSNWENDNILPSVTMLVRIADFFGVTTDFLLGREQSEIISADGLTEEQASHIRLLVKDLHELNYKK